MKKIILIQLCAFFLFSKTHGQYIGKIKISNAVSKKVPSDSIKKAIAEFKTAARNFNNSKTIETIKPLAKAAKKMTSFDKKYKALSDSLTDIENIPKDVDTISVKEEEALVENNTEGNKEEDASGCEELNKVVKIECEKNDDEEYVFNFLDKNGNNLKGFNMIKLDNPALFNDKAKKALKEICDDDEKIKKILDILKQEDVFNQMVYASLDVKDDEVLAMVLHIRQNLSVTIDKNESKSNSLPIKKTVFNNSKFFFNELAIFPKNDADAFTHASFKSEFDNSHPYFFPDNTNRDFVKLEQHLNRVNSLEKKSTDDFIVSDVQIQFQDGFIENIKVIGRIRGTSTLLKFGNSYPIPFSTQRDFRKLHEIYLYEKTIYADDGNNLEGITACYFSVGSLLFVDESNQLYKKDYSPENQVLDVNIDDIVIKRNLYKERTSKILELKVFSDLKGVDGENPNGLIQLEFSRRFNFWNNRKRVRNMFNFGAFNYITPYFTMNKIENDNKRILLHYPKYKVDNDEKQSVFASSLLLLQYQTFGLGLNITGMTVDIPSLKSIFNIGTGFYFGRTLFQDTLRAKNSGNVFEPIKDNNIVQFGLNTFQITPEITWQIFPDSRFGVMLTQRFINFKLLGDKVKQIRDSAHYVNYLNANPTDLGGYSYKRWLGSSELFAFYHPSKYNKIFFRYRFNWDLDNVKENFHQMQLGILTFLSHTKKNKKDRSDPK